MNILNSLPIQVLCLDKRKELWSTLLQELELVSDNIHPFFTGDGEILPKDQYNKINWDRKYMGSWGYGNSDETRWRHWNACISHKLMIERAKTNNWDKFLMCEDDIYITSRFERVWNGVKDKIPDFDLLYLGYWRPNEEDGYDKEHEDNFKEKNIVGIDKMDRAGGLHAVIINSTMYDFILSLPAVNPLDSQLNAYHSKLRSYFVFPKILHVKSNFSFCENGWFERRIL